ncbi:MAG: autotransporter domain-containing protein [Elusimicrobia bacterium]|nr:autotransporter domain-containing protein [Elusimicrobiota bacterium]
MKKVFSLLCVVALLGQQARAADFPILNTTDAAADSLRAGVAASNAAGGANTVTWGAGSAGTITLDSSLPSINANTTLDATNARTGAGAAGAATIAAAAPANTVPLGGAVTFLNGNASQGWTISAIISGAGSLTKTGAGALTLSGVNTYAGGTAINGGTLDIGHDNQLGNAAGAVAFDGGALKTSAAGIASARAITLNAGGGAFDTAGNDSTLTSVINGAGALTKTGAGTLTLNQTNTYAGGTAINAGILDIGNDDRLGNAAGGVAFGGGTLKTTAGGIASARAITLNAGGGTFDTAGNNSTLTSVIGGTGGLTKAGAGALTLNQTNTYTGGTAISAGTLDIGNDDRLGDAAGAIGLNGGTLKTTAGGIASARTVVLNAASTFDTAGNDSTLSGLLYGPGLLTKTGAGTLSLTAVNYHYGGTTVNQGTLKVNADYALGGYSTLTLDNGTLKADGTIIAIRPMALAAGGGSFDTNGNDAGFHGVISGAGSLTKLGAGILYLNANNTYTGGTVLTAGTLSTNSNASLGDPAGLLTFNGGTLQAHAHFGMTRAMTVNAGKTALINPNGYKLALYGAMGGLGGLTQSGEGTLVLNAANTYAGATAVNAGTLQLGIDNALPATALTVAAGGTLDMLGFTLNPASYVGPGTLKLKLRSGVTNLVVGGVATLTNGTLAVSLEPQAVTEGQTFKPITAAGGLGGTQFGSIASPAAISFTPTYNANDVTLTASLVPFANTAIGANQSAVGGSLEPFRANPTGDAAIVLGELYTLDAPDLRSALDKVGPVTMASMGGVAMGNAGVQASAISQRVAVLAGGAARAPSSYVVTGQSPYPGTLLAAAGVADVEPSDRPSLSGSPWGFFASGMVMTGRLTEATSASGVQPGYAFNSGGITGGVDYRVNENLAAGVSCGYLHGHASIYSPASGTVDSHSARFGVYGTGYAENFRVSQYLGGAVDLFSTRRDIFFGNIARAATGSPMGTEFNSDTAAEYDFKTAAWGIFTPFAGLNYDRLMIGSFTEEGAGILSLRVGGQTAESLRSRLGLRYAMKYDVGSYSVTPFVSAGWRRELKNQSHPISAQLSQGAGGTFSVDTGDFARDGTLLGGGLTVDWGERLAARFDYSGDFRSHFMQNVVNASLRLKF